MNDTIQRISDEELDLLIRQVEAAEMVAAPPDLTEKILARLALASEHTEEIPARLNGHQKYIRYCIRVAAAMAAAIALIFALPAVRERGLQDRPQDMQAAQDLQTVQEKEDRQEATHFLRSLHESRVISTAIGQNQLSDIVLSGGR